MYAGPAAGFGRPLLVCSLVCFKMDVSFIIGTPINVYIYLLIWICTDASPGWGGI